MSDATIQSSFTKRVQTNGVVTIPYELRKIHNIEVGDFVTLVLMKVDKKQGKDPNEPTR